MRHSSRMVVGSLAIALAVASAAPAVLAARTAPPPRAQSTALLDGLDTTLGSLLGGVLGTGSQQQLQQLLSQLGNGQPPTGAALAPLRALLGQVAATPGLPTSTRQLIAQVADLLDSDGTGPLAAGLLAPVASLLHGLADTDGVPATATTLLDGVADTLTSSGAGLPIVGQLSLDPSGLTDDLSGVLDALTNGQAPTGEVLAPIAPLLDQVAATPDLPPALGGLLDQLSGTIESTPGALDPLTTSQLSTVLSLIGNTPGVPGWLRTLIERTSTTINDNSTQAPNGSAKAKAHAATRRDRAVIVSVHVNRAHTRVRARIACPRSAPKACSTTSRVTLDGSRAAAAKRVRVGRGVSKTVRLRLIRSARSAAAQHGGRLRFTLATRFGARTFSTQRTLRLSHHRR